MHLLPMLVTLLNVLPFVYKGIEISCSNIITSFIKFRRERIQMLAWKQTLNHTLELMTYDNQNRMRYVVNNCNLS